MEAPICEPASMMMFAASAALSVASAAIKSGQSMGDYNAKIAAANAEGEAVNRSTIFKYATSGLQQIQVEDQAAIQEGQDRLKLSGAEGEASAAAASGGVTGNSIRDLYRSYAVATGSDIANIEADEKGKLDQAQTEKRADQQSAQNQLLGIKESLPQDPSASIVGNYVGAALGVGKDFMADTTPVTGGSGGLFGAGGFLGIGRKFG